jgi:two-component system, OmpR family, sensor histidine kinase MprB
MTFRRRVIVLAAAAVATAIVLGSAATYVIVRHDLQASVDRQLRSLVDGVLVRTPTVSGDRAGLSAREVDRIRRVVTNTKGRRRLRALLGPELAAAFQRELARPSGGDPGEVELVVPRTSLDLPAGYVQYVSRQRIALGPQGPGKQLLPVTAGTVAVARGDRRAFYEDATVAGVHVRVLTAPVTGGAVQAAIALDAVDNTLDRLALVLVLVSLAGVGLAVGLGVLVARAALTPVAALTATTEQVSRTRDLGERLAVRGGDELARLAMSFNRMMAALEASSHARRQLVADASHELRTPLASLLMNIELLGEERRMAAGDRERVIADLSEQIHELTVLVGDLVDLARDEPTEAEAEAVRLDELVADAVARAERHAPNQRFTLDSEPTTVTGVPARLERAVNNLLDNAVKWNPSRQPIEVAVRDGQVSVRDHGPGFAADDLPHVFDRFYRATRSRGLPGAGLGLAIVRQVADAHGGTIEAENAAGGGALLRLRLPPAAALSKSLPAS